jgi:hypothetical protein
MVARMRGIAKILFTLMHTLVPLLTLRTPCVNAAAKNRTDYAHRKCRVMQVVVARLCSVVLPCLQIRVGRFDSGPRLQYIAQLADAVVHFFCVHTSAQATATPTLKLPDIVRTAAPADVVLLRDGESRCQLRHV